MVPEWLENYAKGSVSTAGYVPMGGKFGGKDIRKGMPKVGLAVVEEQIRRVFEPRQSDCAPSEDIDQPGHPPSLIRVFAV